MVVGFMFYTLHVMPRHPRFFDKLRNLLQAPRGCRLSLATITDIPFGPLAPQFVQPVRIFDGLEISCRLKKLHLFSISLKPGPLKSFVRYDGAKSEPRSRNSQTRNRH